MRLLILEGSDKFLLVLYVCITWSTLTQLDWVWINEMKKAKFKSLDENSFWSLFFYFWTFLTWLFFLKKMLGFSNYFRKNFNDFTTYYSSNLVKITIFKSFNIFQWYQKILLVLVEDSRIWMIVKIKEVQDWHSYFNFETYFFNLKICWKKFGAI